MYWVVLLEQWPMRMSLIIHALEEDKIVGAGQFSATMQLHEVSVKLRGHLRVGVVAVVLGWMGHGAKLSESRAMSILPTAKRPQAVHTGPYAPPRGRPRRPHLRVKNSGRQWNGQNGGCCPSGKEWRRWESNPRPQPLHVGVYVCSSQKTTTARAVSIPLTFVDGELVRIFFIPPRDATSRFGIIQVKTRPDPSPWQHQVRTALN